MTSCEQDIHLLKEMKRIIQEYIYLKESDQNYTINPVLNASTELIEKINDRLAHFCQHNIVKDIIEVGDKTKIVYYCDLCDTTF